MSVPTGPGWRSKVLQINPYIGFCRTGLEGAITYYADSFIGVNPTTLIVSVNDTHAAYELLSIPNSLPRLSIVPVPGLPTDYWAVAGQYGLVYACPQERV